MYILYIILCIIQTFCCFCFYTLLLFHFILFHLELLLLLLFRCFFLLCLAFFCFSYTFSDCNCESMTDYLLKPVIYLFIEYLNMHSHIMYYFSLLLFLFVLFCAYAVECDYSIGNIIFVRRSIQYIEIILTQQKNVP